MGKRYFCDYCDKTFPDNAHNRKKHLSGLQHQKLVKLHYQSFKDPQEILTEELNKRPCKKYLTNGDCNFYPNCRFSHLTPEWEQQLRRDIKTKKTREIEKQIQKDKDGERKCNILDKWLDKRGKTLQTNATKLTSSGASFENNKDEPFHLPPALRRFMTFHHP